MEKTGYLNQIRRFRGTDCYPHIVDSCVTKNSSAREIIGLTDGSYTEIDLSPL